MCAATLLLLIISIFFITAVGQRTDLAERIKDQSMHQKIGDYQPLRSYNWRLNRPEGQHQEDSANQI